MKNLAVIMTVYNEELDYLSLAIETTLTALDKIANSKLFIYVDNRNELLREHVVEYLSSLSKDKVTVIFSNRNIGLADSLNYLIDKFCDEFKYVARMDADDICEENRFVEQLRVIVEENLDVVGTNAIKIDETNAVIGEINNRENPSFLYGNEMIHPSLLFRAKVLKSLSGYRSYSCAQDYDLLCRAKAMSFKIKNIEKHLLRYRIRSGAIGQRNKKEQLVYKLNISSSFRKGNILDETVAIGCNYSFYDKVEEFRDSAPILYRFLSCFSRLHLNKYFLTIMKHYR